MAFRPWLVVLAGLFVLPLAAANPVVPYCPGSVGGIGSVAVADPATCELVTGRIFPEALQATDFVSLPEAEAGLRELAARAPDRVQIIELGRSFGWDDGAGGHDTFPVYAVEVTNKNSPVPMDERLQLLFMLSIHGNEKGGREGGLRVIEDFALGRASALDAVQHGAGLPSPLAKPTGGEVRTYADYLDFTRLVFLFPNPDGWVHDEPPYATQRVCAINGVLYCRTNGNGTDLNRQMPSIGWQFINPATGRLPVNSPEARAFVPWLAEHRFNYAIDIHGMLNHENFVAIMMPAGSLSPQEMLRTTRLAEELKGRLNTDDHFAAWTDLVGRGMEDTAVAGCLPEPVADAAMQAAQRWPQGVPGRGVLSTRCVDGTGVASTEFSDWSTVWDAIGYTDSGVSGDYFAQASGLNAPGFDIEMAYNHITVDSQYEGAGAMFNDYHVHVVRNIVQSFMDAAALDVQVSIETHGVRAAYVRPTFVATNLDDQSAEPGDWAARNPHDDAWEYSAARPFAAAPARYWDELKPFLRSGDHPAVLDGLGAGQLGAETLARYDTLAIPGSAIRDLDEAAIAAVRDWTEAGGRLVLTDEALRFLDLAGVSRGGVDRVLQYAGAINLDRSHELVADVRGEARQTYEPVPLGYSLATDSSPVWAVDPEAFKALGGDAAGWTLANFAGKAGVKGVALGRMPLGAGSVSFIGAVLPDPTEEFYHPYGLDSYATTYSGNQLLRNLLGWEEVFIAPPVVLLDQGIVQSVNDRLPVAESGDRLDLSADVGTPGIGTAFLLVVLALAAMVSARRP